MGFWQELLDGYIDGSVPEPLPNQKLGMGTLDEWKPGFVSKTWKVDPELFHGRALFGGYIAALADQVLGLAAMTVEVLVSCGFAAWLMWFLLRDGLPPSRMIISESDQKIGLQNLLATRWFSIEEVGVVSDSGQCLLGLDGRKLLVSEATLAQVHRLIKSRVAENHE